MFWKLATVAALAGVAFVLLRGRGEAAGPGGGAPVGAEMKDVRGAQALAARQITLGAKAVAESAKANVLGETRAADRQEAKAIRKG